MSLEIYIDRYKHPDGKEYLNAIVRDANTPSGPALHITNWSGLVSDDFSIGQVGWQEATYTKTAEEWHAKEADKRRRRTYKLIDSLDWRPMSIRQHDNLQAKGVSYAVFNGSPQPAYAPPTDMSGNPVETDPETGVVSVPGSTVLGPKRVEWVMEHPDHPEAFSQMIHAAGQLQKVVDDAKGRVEKAETDLEFARAWMSARMRQEAG